MSTPNRITFSPGLDTPLNPFHTRELNAAELTELLEEARLRGGGHARGFPRPAAGRARRPPRWLDHRRADRRARWPDAPWPAELLADVESVTVDDFDLLAGESDIDDSLDLVAIAVRP